MAEQLGRYRIPKEFKDEDKWFRFFTKRQLIYAIVALAFDAIALMLSYSFNVLLVGIILSEIVSIVMMAFAFITIPTEQYMYGGGYLLSTIVLRVIIRRRKKNRILYVKNYDNELQE